MKIFTIPIIIFTGASWMISLNAMQQYAVKKHKDSKWQKLHIVTKQFNREWPKLGNSLSGNPTSSRKNPLTSSAVQQTVKYSTLLTKFNQSSSQPSPVAQTIQTVSTSIVAHTTTQPHAEDEGFVIIHNEDFPVTNK
jgi:hypothetical protein